MNPKSKKEENEDWHRSKDLLFFRLADQDRKLGDLVVKSQLTSEQLKNVEHRLETLTDKVLSEIEAQADWRLENTKGAWKMKAALLGGIISFIGIVIKEIYAYTVGAK